MTFDLHQLDRGHLVEKHLKPPPNAVDTVCPLGHHISNNNSEDVIRTGDNSLGTDSYLLTSGLLPQTAST